MGFIFQMDDSLSGRGAKAVQRDRKTGLKRDLEQEQAEQRAKDAKEDVKKEKYTRWGKGYAFEIICKFHTVLNQIFH